MKLVTMISLFLTFSQGALAAEADNFTAHSLNLPDVSERLNTLANAHLRKAVIDANAQGSCEQIKSEDVLYAELRKYFANHSKGELVKSVLYANALSINALPIKDSIYKEWKVKDGYLLGRKKAATSPLALSPLIKIGDQIVGVDKLEHMFGMGFSYFTKHYQKGKDITSVLKAGIFAEKTILGGNVLATGVFSFGDLSANFNGMRFWNHVLQKEDDILGAEHNLGPYISCQNGQWNVVEKNPIDFRNYIDASMDESINCSKFASNDGVVKFKRAINDMGYTCPMDPLRLKEIKQKYGPHRIEHFIINDEGTGKVSYFNEF